MVARCASGCADPAGLFLLFERQGQCRHEINKFVEDVGDGAALPDKLGAVSEGEWFDGRSVEESAEVECTRHIDESECVGDGHSL